MRQLGESGVWELFVPGRRLRHRLQVRRSSAPTAQWREKADPMACCAEVPPATRVGSSSRRYAWGDDAWMRERGAASSRSHEPMSVYEVHLGSWRKRHGQPLTCGQLADELVRLRRATSASPTSS